MKKISIFLAACVLLCPVVTRSQSTIPSSGGAAVNVSGLLNASLIVPTTCPNNNTVLVGVPFTCQLALSGAGGVPPYNYGSVTGGFPSGMSMTTGVNGGLVSGTATSTTTTTATFPVSDSSTPAQVVTVTLSYSPLAILSGGVSITCPPQSVLASGTLACHSTGTFGVANSPDNKSASLDSLATFSCPATCGSTGASFTNNILTAGTAGTANVEATFQSVTSSLLPITVATSGSPIVIGYPTAAGGLPNGQQYQAYPDQGVPGQAGVGQCIQVQASGGTPPYTYTISSGSLPPGLTLGSSTGMICGNGTTAASGSSLTIQVADSASHTQTVVITNGITIAGLSSLIVNLANNPITPNAQTQATAIGTYSDSTTNAPLPNALAAQFGPSAVGTGTNATSIQVSSGTATTTGWAAIGIAQSWENAACTNTTMAITSPNETFTSIASPTGQSGVGPPNVNCIQTFLATNVTGNAADKPTCTFSRSTGSYCVIQYFLDIPTSSLLDQSPANTVSTSNSATSCVPNSLTTTQPNEIIFGLCWPNGASGFTNPSGYSSLVTFTSGSQNFDLFGQVVNAVQTSIAPAASFSGGANNEVAALFSVKGNTPAAGGVLWFSGTTPNATITATGLITGQPITSTGTSVITACVGGTGGATCTGGVSNTATLTVQVTNPDTSILIVPNPTATVTLLSGGGFTCSFSGPAPTNTPCQFQAIGNVTGQQYQAQWGISNPPNVTVASINSSSGTIVGPVAVGTATVQATVSGFSSSATTTLNVVSQATGTIITATDCSLTALNNAWNQMTSGAYIIQLPSCAAGGTGTYNAQFSQTVPANVTSLTIQGNTTIACSGTAGTSTYACTATDNTVLVDSYNSPNSTMWLISTGSTSGLALRITGITFQGGTLASAHKPNGFIELTGNSAAFRLDHNHFNERTYSCFNCGGGLTMFGSWEGVADHNIADQLTPDNWLRDYGSGGMGNAAWAAPTQWGTQHFIFLELNVINGGFANDCNDGGRMVARYNSIYANSNDTSGNSGTFQQHAWGQGTDTDGGCRATEAYHNFFHNPTPANPTYSALDGATGSSVQYYNTVDPGQNYVTVLQFVREPYPDNNCGTGNTTNGCGFPPSGIGYCGNSANGQTSAWDGNSIASTGYPCMHQVGRGQGQLLSGNTPNMLNTITGTISWPHEMREPQYMWGNTGGNNSLYLIVTYVGVGPVANRDFYAECTARDTYCSTAFNGTAGVGIGTLPPTNASAYSGAPNCTAGPGGTYDTSPTGSYGVGFWDSAANSGQGELYICTSTNTWTPVYQPYVYPHPLDH